MKLQDLAVEIPLSEISRHRHEALDLEVNFHIKFSCNYVSGETVQSLCNDSSFEKRKLLRFFMESIVHVFRSYFEFKNDIS